MDYQTAKHQFGRNLQTHRVSQGITQEKLAEQIDKSTEHISFMERGERSPSFETLIDLADALDVSLSALLGEEPTYTEDVINTLDVAPVPTPLPEPLADAPEIEQKRRSDLERLDAALDGIRQMQELATEYGINDILQDNGGKVLQVLILLGLKISPGREGNDAVDADGNEYELKTVNIAFKKSQSVTTHHHLNKDILDKYRAVKAWFIATYEGIELKEIYSLSPAELEPLFSLWETRVEKSGALNNPKIPMRMVRSSTRVYPTE